MPALPSLECSNKRARLEPLTIEEYESKFRQSATDLELVERVFFGSMSCNQLRAALWPYLFGLVKHRGMFERIVNENGQDTYLYIEDENNVSRWTELQKLYHVYQNQWKSILPDQESRFSTYRERKSLIERDVIRSDQLHQFYAEEPQNSIKLTNLLMTYMMYDFDIGYVQGMSDLAGPILYMYKGDLVKAFWIFVEVMKLHRRNFELTQKTIHFQLNCLYELIKNTDPIFAQFLEENESSDCFFAFRAIFCQFKRELMRNDEDDYSKVLFLWDTIWSVKRRHELMSKYVNTYNISNGCNGKQQNNRTTFHHSSFDPKASRFELSESDKFVLALCMSMISQEREQILLDCLDASDIHRHFTRPRLANNLDEFIEKAYSIYDYLKTCDMKGDFDENKESANSYDLLREYLIISPSILGRHY